MKKIVWLIAIIAVSVLLMSAIAQAWTTTKVKTRTLSIAGDVTLTSSFRAIDGETIAVTIWPADPSVTISDVTLAKVAPKLKIVDDSNIVVSGTGDYAANVTLNNDRRDKSTFHLHLRLSTGEQIGVNVSFGR